MDPGNYRRGFGDRAQSRMKRDRLFIAVAAVGSSDSSLKREGMRRLRDQEGKPVAIME